MEAKNSFVFYRSFYEAIKDLPRDVQGEIYTAIMEYGLYGNEVEQLKPIAKSIFTLIKPQLEANVKRYENGKKGAEYGVLGGRPKKKTNNQKEENKNPKKPLENPKETPNVNVNDNVNVNVNDNVNNNYHDVDNQSSNIFHIYENEFRRPLTQIEMTKILEMKEKFSDELIAHALGIAVEKNARNFSYVKAILESFEQKGIRTVQEAIEDQESFKKQKLKSLSKYPAKKPMQEPNYTKPAEDSNDEDVARILEEIEKLGVG